MSKPARKKIVVNLSLTLEVSPVALYALLLRENADAVPGMEEALLEADFDRGLLDPDDPERVAEPPAQLGLPFNAPPARAAKAPRPSKATRTAAKANGAMPVEKVEVEKVEPEPEPVMAEPVAEPVEEEPVPENEPDMRALLMEVVHVAPTRQIAVVDILKAVGGASHLVNCPKETWPAIARAARAVIAAHTPGAGP
jgi:hypothetical protein